MGRPGSNWDIRNSTDADIDFIHQWIVNQENDGVHGSFLCNWNLSLQKHNEGNLLVCIDEAHDEPVAYMWADLGIIEVRGDKRGAGIGRTMVEYVISCAQESDIVAIDVECSPTTSIPFWEHMGFRIYDGNHAYLLLDKNFILPEDGISVSVDIRFYPEYKKWKPNTKALEFFSPKAVKMLDNTIHLECRVSIFNSVSIWVNDAVIGINVDGIELYLDKAKYDDASHVGVRQSSNGFFIEHILYVRR